MTVASSAIRLFLAVWFCTGLHIHIAMEHGADSHHDHHVSPESCRSVDYLADADIQDADCDCCFHAPTSPHHDPQAPHPHVTEASQPGSAKRILPLPVVASLTPAAIEHALTVQQPAAYQPYIFNVGSPALTLPNLRAPPAA